MFTLLPSLYLIGVHYYRQWNSSRSHSSKGKSLIQVNTKEKILERKDVQVTFNEQSIPSESSENHGYSHKSNSSLSEKRKSHRKKSHRRRRKSSISALTHEDIGYLMHETEFPEEKIVTWYGDFLHDCPDGKLSKSKFIHIYQQFYRKGQVTKFCEHAFRLFNKDGSGYMDFMEFLLAVNLTSSKEPQRKIELFFSIYDIDQNGLIDTQEMRSFVESVYELLGIDIRDPSRVDAKVYEIFSKAECDQLGYLRPDQFAMACENDRHIRKLLVSNTKYS